MLTILQFIFQLFFTTIVCTVIHCLSYCLILTAYFMNDSSLSSYKGYIFYIDIHSNENLDVALFPELQDAVDEVLPALLEQQVSVFILADRCKTPDVKSFKDLMSQASSEPISKNLRSHITLRSPAVYIYTSGTTGELLQVWQVWISTLKEMILTSGVSLTGFPKAAAVTYSKLWVYSLIMSTSGMKSNDVVYICLPTYHTTALLGVFAAMDVGMHTFEC